MKTLTIPTKDIKTAFLKAERNLLLAKENMLNYKLKWLQAENRSNHINQAQISVLTGINSALQEINELRQIYEF